MIDCVACWESVMITVFAGEATVTPASEISLLSALLKRLQPKVTAGTPYRSARSETNLLRLALLRTRR